MSVVGHKILLRAVLQKCCFLVLFGLIDFDDIGEWLQEVLHLVDILVYMLKLAAKYLFHFLANASKSPSLFNNFAQIAFRC